MGVAEWVLSLGCTASTLSALTLAAGMLELQLILGPLGPCCKTYWPHNLAAGLLWLPTVGLAAWQWSHESHAKAALAFIILGTLCLFSHLLVLFTYYLRGMLRRQQAKELPTQQLLAEAHRLGPQGPTPAFQMQVGRSDGHHGYTIFISGAEAEEQALRLAADRHNQRMLPYPSLTRGKGSSPPQQVQVMTHVMQPSALTISVTGPRTSSRAYPSPTGPPSTQSLLSSIQTAGVGVGVGAGGRSSASGAPHAAHAAHAVGEQGPPSTGLVAGAGAASTQPQSQQQLPPGFASPSQQPPPLWCSTTSSTPHTPHHSRDHSAEEPQHTKVSADSSSTGQLAYLPPPPQLVTNGQMGGRQASPLAPQQQAEKMWAAAATQAVQGSVFSFPPLTSWGQLGPGGVSLGGGGESPSGRSLTEVSNPTFSPGSHQGEPIGSQGTTTGRAGGAAPDAMRSLVYTAGSGSLLTSEARNNPQLGSMSGSDLFEVPGLLNDAYSGSLAQGSMSSQAQGSYTFRGPSIQLSAADAELSAPNCPTVSIHAAVPSHAMVHQWVDAGVTEMEQPPSVSPVLSTATSVTIATTAAGSGASMSKKGGGAPPQAASSTANIIPPALTQSSQGWGFLGRGSLDRNGAGRGSSAGGGGEASGSPGVEAGGGDLGRVSGRPSRHKRQPSDGLLEDLGQISGGLSAAVPAKEPHGWAQRLLGRLANTSTPGLPAAAGVAQGEGGRSDNTAAPPLANNLHAAVPTTHATNGHGVPHGSPAVPTHKRHMRTHSLPAANRSLTTSLLADFQPSNPV